MSECFLYVIKKMRDCTCLNAFYVILLSQELECSELSLCDIKIRDCICLNALYMILLKREVVYISILLM